MSDSVAPGDLVRRVALQLVSIPDGFKGAVRFEASERAELLTFLLVHMTCGWSASDDLFLIPDHGKQIVWFDHHEVVHVNFAEAEQVNPFVQQMAAAGYALPTEPPDPTFKQQDWMGSS